MANYTSTQWDVQTPALPSNLRFDYDVYSHRMMADISTTGVKGVQAVGDVEVSATMTVLWINVLVFIVLMASYELLSRVLPSVYAGRRFSNENDHFPIRIFPTIFPLGWVPQVARISWPDVLKTGGLDAYMFLRYIRMCLMITTVSGFWGSVVLFPTFATGGGGAEGWYFLSMANIPTGSLRLWVPTTFMWFLTFFVFYLMNEEYKHYLELRMDYLVGSGKEDSSDSQHLYSLVVDNIPHQLRSDEALFKYFEELFPDNVFSASVVMNIPDLEYLCARRQRVLQRLEKSIAIHEATGKRARHVVGRKRIKFFGIETLPINPLGG